MRGIVKGFVIGTLGLAVLFGSPAVSLAKLAGGVYCLGLAQLPPGMNCPTGTERTTVHAEGGGCVMLCCKDNLDGRTMDCSANPVRIGADALRNVLPGGTLAPPEKVRPRGVKPPVTPSPGLKQP